MTLKEWMRPDGVSDAEMTARIGIVTAGAAPTSELLPKGAPAPEEEVA